MTDTAVTFHPYFKVGDEKLEVFKRIAQDLVETTRGEMGCLYYGFSYSDGEAFCREGYKDADSLVAHLDNVGDLLQKLENIVEAVRVEVHGPEKEIAKLREWQAIEKLNPTFFVLEAGFRN